MGEPTDEAMREARKQARIHGYGPDGVDAVVFAAGWTAGVAEGRRQAASEIRAVDVARVERLHGDTALVGLIVAARIAAGDP